MLRNLFVAAGLGGAILLSLPAQGADQARTLGRFDDWDGFTYTDRAGKVCYTASVPKRSLNAPKGRKDVYVSISNRPKDGTGDVFSVTAGFPLKKGAPAEIDIGGARFELFTEDDTAWTRTDKAVVQAMLKGKSLIVHLTPAKGDPVSDTYSLNGFPRAHAEISKACGGK